MFLSQVYFHRGCQWRSYFHLWAYSVNPGAFWFTTWVGVGLDGVRQVKTSGDKLALVLPSEASTLSCMLYSCWLLFFKCTEDNFFIINYLRLTLTVLHINEKRLRTNAAYLLGARTWIIRDWILDPWFEFASCVSLDEVLHPFCFGFSPCQTGRVTPEGAEWNTAAATTPHGP